MAEQPDRRIAAAAPTRYHLSSFASMGNGWTLTLDDYGACVKRGRATKFVTWAPFGGGNKAQSMNASLKPEDIVSYMRTSNTVLCPVTYTLRNAKGKRCKEYMLVVVQVLPVKKDKQLRLYYGREYTILPEKSIQDDAMESEPAEPTVKTEPASPPSFASMDLEDG